MQRFLIILIFSFFTINCTLAHEYHNNVFTATVTKNAVRGDVAVYNLSNAKLHTSDCEWAEKCTKNCIYIDKNKVHEMFFVPCIVCGGGVVEPMKYDKK